VYVENLTETADRARALARLVRLRAEIDRLNEVEYDPWRYDPALRPDTGARSHDGRDSGQDDRLAI
jgi:hypothetical protein